MVAATVPRHKPKARVVFAQALAVEFGLTKGHVYRVLIGERSSPQHGRLRARQLELIRAAKKEAKK